MTSIKNTPFYLNVQKAIESFNFSVVLLAVGFLCWILNLTAVLVSLFVAGFVAVLIFCKDVKNIFAPLFYVSFFIPDIKVMTDYAVYIIVVGIAVISLLAFFIVKLIKERKKVKFGKLAYGILAFAVACLLGGAIGRFNIVKFLEILGFFVAIYILYFIAVNYTRNIKSYLEKIFIVGAVLLSYQVAQTNFGSEIVIFFSAQGVNTAALFITLGIIACFTIALKSEKDYLFFLLIILLTAGVISSRCRMGMLLTAIIDVFFTIILIKKSPKRRYIIYILLGIFFCIGIAILASEQVKELIKKLMFSKIGLSGREGLWSWCFDRFLEHPLLGYGFFADGNIPHLREGIRLILTHNTLLQWLVCTGVVGVIIISVFYVSKWYVLLKGASWKRIFPLTCVIMLSLSGMLDQAANMDVFVTIIILVLVVCVEKENDAKIFNN